MPSHTGRVTEARTSTAPTFAPPCGPVVGWVDDTVVRATGIPYATAERFAPPSPAPDWTEPLEATNWSPICPQAPLPLMDEVLGGDYGEIVQDEACQRVSVTAPRDARPGEGLSVMVWIHGGSYVWGAGDGILTDPKPLVTEQRVIVVTVTYRLGLFGYLGGAGRPANLGLLDQLEALRWVRRNISAFGGDPGNVTVFGQSAGGDAVAHLMATPDAVSLFRRAIIQSAPLGISRGRRRMSAAMARAAADLSTDLTVEEVVARQPAVERRSRPYGLIAAMPFGTQYGHAPLPPERRIDEAWRAVAPRIDVLIGRTAQETSLFASRVPGLERVASAPAIGRRIVSGIVRATTWAVYGRGMRRFARRHARAGGRVHEYVIDWADGPYGASHVVDVPLLFGDADAWRRAKLLDGADWSRLTAAGREVRRIWANFARGADLGDDGAVPGVIRYRRG